MRDWIRAVASTAGFVLMSTGRCQNRADDRHGLQRGDRRHYAQPTKEAPQILRTRAWCELAESAWRQPAVASTAVGDSEEARDASRRCCTSSKSE